MINDMQEIEVVVAHSERVTLRVGDVFLKIDTDQGRLDREVEVIARAPIPTPEVLWRKPPALALGAVPGTALGVLGETSRMSSAAWVAAGAAVRMLHDAPPPPWPSSQCQQQPVPGRGDLNENRALASGDIDEGRGGARRWHQAGDRTHSERPGCGCAGGGGTDSERFADMPSSSTRPSGAPQVLPYLYYPDAARALVFLTEAFGFTEIEAMRDEDGTVWTAQMSTGDGVVLIGPEIPDFGTKAPDPAWATSRTFVYIDDVDDHCDRARAAGAVITTEPADHGPNRIYVATDCGGQQWIFARPGS